MLLKNKTIIFLGNIRFDSHIKATSLFLARNLAKYNKVFFVDYPFTIKDYLTHKNSPELQVRKEKFQSSSDGIIDTDIPNLKIIITPPVLPINFLPEGFIYRSALKINERTVINRIKKVLQKFDITDFVFINSFNFHFPNVGKALKPTLNIYHCVDPMIVPYDMKHGILSEKQLVKESDVVICTSKALYEEKKKLNSHTYFVPNAADIAYFTEAVAANIPIHPLLQNLPKPIIGYLGTVERRIDYSLLQETALQNSDKTFVLAGPVWDEHIPNGLRAIKNIHIIGPIPYAEVPQLVNSFDIAIIPFKKDDVSKTIFPLKLFEYLSLGKPVILTSFNTDLKDFTDDTVYYCDDAAMFTQCINHALSTPDTATTQQRMNLAKQNTWENRADQIAQIIYNHLPVSNK